MFNYELHVLYMWVLITSSLKRGGIMKTIINFLRDEAGASMAEYALLLGLITVAIATVITAFGTRISGTITNATNALPQ